jgi:hypothetical protein
MWELWECGRGGAEGLRARVEKLTELDKESSSVERGGKKAPLCKMYSRDQQLTVDIHSAIYNMNTSASAMPTPL